MAIDPDFLDELDRLDASLKRQTAALKKGEQDSPNVGEGLTFSDYRRYAPGDDTRLIDWRLYARTDELFVKQFEEERNLTVHVLLDASGSMDYGEGDHHKFEYGAKLGLGFAYLTAEEHNEFRFSTVQQFPERLDAGTSNRGEVLQLIERLNETEPAGEADFETAFEAYDDSIRSRSLVVIVSDFLGDLDGLETGVAALARNDVLLVHVMAPEEVEPDAGGDTIFEDLETDQTRRTYFGGRLEQQYQQRLAAHVEGVAERAQDLGVAHETVQTDEPFFDAFASLWVG
jgi:uncharacterized protein (DUF58 family)